jgi:5'-AMP-activated protein kinase, regulatory gamma subunit
VITLIKDGVYEDLDLSVGEALQTFFSRINLTLNQDYPGIYTCSPEDGLDTIFDTIRKSCVHRWVVVDEPNHLKGVISLTDILRCGGLETG